MGSAVSILDSHYSDSSSTDSTNSSTTGKASYTSTDTAKANMARHPTYIPIPSPYFASISITPSPSHRLEDPFASPLISPALTFYTAPSSPIPSPMAEETVLFQLTSVEVSQPSVSGSGLQMSLPAAQPYQPMSLMSPRYSPATTSPHPLANSIEPDPPLHSPMADTDDTFPDVPDIEMALDDEGMEGLNPLEKIYLYSISKATYHRIFICRDLPNLLDLLTPQEAVEYVLPLLHILSKDQEESVREALTSGLSSVIWWFLTNCQITEEDGDFSDPPMTPPAISVDAFTVILGRLVLSPSSVVGTAAKAVVVDLLARLCGVDHAETQSGSNPSTPQHTMTQNNGETFGSQSDDQTVSFGYFDSSRRSLFKHELLASLIAGLDRLSDTEAAIYESGEYVNEDDESQEVDAWGGSIRTEDDSDSAGHLESYPQPTENINPYFPILPPKSPTRQSSVEPYVAVLNESSSSSSTSSPASTPSSTSSTSSSISEADATIAVTNTRGRETPPSRIALPASNFHSPSRPGSPSYFPISSRTSPKSSPLNQITPDPHVSQYAALTRTVSSAQHEYDGLMGLEPSAEGSTLDGSEETNETVDLSASQEEQEQVAVKRMASVNLMALAASKGCLEPSSEISFVHEIERFSVDPVPWVRRETSFAIGALAKSVPDEVVHMSLLPLLENLISDTHPHVRHSSLFSLPSVLARLPLKQRQAFALQSVNALATDDSPEVRAGVLESLGEIIYTFHTEEPSITSAEPVLPDEILVMFMGQRDDLRWRHGQQPFDRDKGDHLKLFYADPSRPLITAFNYPAVTKTLGPDRWDSSLRETYLRLANNPAFGVRRTLAASVGDMAQILGPQITERDLMGVWRDSVDTRDAEIRMKTVDCLGTFFDAIGYHGKQVVLDKLLDAWKSGQWTGWKERESIVVAATAMIESVSKIDQQGMTKLMSSICGLVVQALADNVSAVREAAVHCLPTLWPVIRFQPHNLEKLRLDLQAFARSDNSRRRMTYISCQQTLLLPRGQAMQPLVPFDDELSKPLRDLATDSVIGVRIGVARLVATLFADQVSKHYEIKAPLVDLVKVFSRETSREVMLYVPDLSILRPKRENADSVASPAYDPPTFSEFAVFSRPPPPSVHPHQQS